MPQIIVSNSIAEKERFVIKNFVFFG